jgi:hypothetical protein
MHSVDVESSADGAIYYLLPFIHRLGSVFRPNSMHTAKNHEWLQIIPRRPLSLEMVVQRLKPVHHHNRSPVRLKLTYSFRRLQLVSVKGLRSIGPPVRLLHAGSRHGERPKYAYMIKPRQPAAARVAYQQLFDYEGRLCRVRESL